VADPDTRLLTLLSLVYPAYYLLVSWGISLKVWRKKRRKLTDATGCAKASS
jgi:hypothetical protein